MGLGILVHIGWFQLPNKEAVKSQGVLCQGWRRQAPPTPRLGCGPCAGSGSPYSPQRAGPWGRAEEGHPPGASWRGPPPGTTSLQDFSGLLKESLSYPGLLL